MHRPTRGRPRDGRNSSDDGRKQRFWRSPIATSVPPIVTPPGRSFECAERITRTRRENQLPRSCRNDNPRSLDRHRTADRSNERVRNGHVHAGFDASHRTCSAHSAGRGLRRSRDRDRRERVGRAVSPRGPRGKLGHYENVSFTLTLAEDGHLTAYALEGELTADGDRRFVTEEFTQEITAVEPTEPAWLEEGRDEIEERMNSSSDD
ncbi:hypothetical protein SAMN04489841_1570 [Natrinema salaciae]|uniref:Uncharacterized protein n=1 Tax=Natrinema salaciae TaxID=1186196 RepID=A0A1H9FHB8_9EURY|nr:hypothetical protein SAMN04489841_1570 [Natrinema salaciae]